MPRPPVNRHEYFFAAAAAAACADTAAPAVSTHGAGAAPRRQRTPSSLRSEKKVEIKHDADLYGQAAQP